jgi:hypothetical protein
VVVMKIIIFWDTTPCSPLSFAGFAEPVSSTLEMEAIYSSETSVETKRTTRRHIPEDDTLQKSGCTHSCHCPVKNYFSRIYKGKKGTL